MAVVSDNFDRANGALGTNWTQSAGNIQISGNQVYSDGFGVAEWAGSVIGADQYSKVTIVGLGSGVVTSEVGVRKNGSASTATHDGYLLVITSAGATVRIERSDNDSYTTLITLSPGVTFASGDVAELRIIGTVLQAYKNGSAVGSSTTDETYSSGQPGFNIYDNTDSVFIDNWEGGDLGAQPSGKLLIHLMHNL